MRTTVVIPDDLYKAAVVFLNQEQLAKAIEEGYQAESESPSLHQDWSNVELDAWS